MYIIYIILYIGLSIKNCGCAQTFNGNPNAGILMDFGVGYFQTHPNDFGMDQKIGTLCWVLKWILLHGELGRIISVPLSWYSSTKGYHRNYILCDCKSRSEIEGWIHFIGRYYIYMIFTSVFVGCYLPSIMLQLVVQRGTRGTWTIWMQPVKQTLKLIKHEAVCRI